jgi:3-oxoacyl-[acyl-carrier protein] reductase
MDLGMKGRVALVTGASRGLGLAIARELAREGARLAIVARGKEGLTDVARQLEQDFETEVFPFPGDVSHHEGMAVIVLAVASKLGGLDILVNNTGGPAEGRFEQLRDKDWQTSFEGTFLSVVQACREAIPYMRKKGWGRIVNILSVSARQPIEGLFTSSALRAGLVGFTKTLSQEMAKDHITVNAVLPGFTQTERLQDLARTRAKEQGVTPEAILDGWRKAVPAGRLGEPEEVGKAVAFLASEAASYITGVSLAVDGGYIKGLP